MDKIRPIRRSADDCADVERIEKQLRRLFTDLATLRGPSEAISRILVALADEQSDWEAE